MIALYQPLSSLTLCFFQAVLLGDLGLVYGCCTRRKPARPGKPPCETRCSG
ncbi:MAG: hypothetical protein ACLUB2_01585 [Butyricicoccus pullicaecorum]